MNPNTCLLQLLDAVMDEDYLEAHCLGVGLLGWLRNGGYSPDLNALSEAHKRIIAKAVCWGVINPAKE